jgi:hypothetical protein
LAHVSAIVSSNVTLFSNSNNNEQLFINLATVLADKIRLSRLRKAVPLAAIFIKFSERLGYRPVKTQLQVEELSEELKNSLWSAFLESFLKVIPNDEYAGYKLTEYVRALWFSFFKLPLDRAPLYDDNYGRIGVFKDELTKTLRQFFLNNKNWYDPYDLIQFSAKYADHKFVPFINRILEKEKSGYRFINGELVQITSKTEIEEIEQAITSTNNIEAVSSHLNAALKHLSDKENPVYRNSIKESISAVEAICKIYTKNEKSTLGDALTKLEKEGSIHPALKKAFSALYGYTSDSAGIRNALIENDRPVDFHEAKFMLVTCTSFINYLLSKMS